MAALAQGLVPQPPVFGSSHAALVRQWLAALGNSIDPVVSLGQAVVPELITIFLTDLEAIIRTRAAAALGRIGEAQAAVTLVRGCGDPDPVVRALSTAAICQLMGR